MRPGQTVADVGAGAGAHLHPFAAALKLGGRRAALDFEREPGVSSAWILGHVRAGKATVRAEIEAAGFDFVAEPDVPGLNDNDLMVFRKPTTVADAHLLPDIAE